MIKGVSGPTLGQSGGNIDNYGTDGAQTNAMGQRRPHTAHGGRAGFPSSSAPIAGGAQGAMYNDGGEDVSGLLYFCLSLTFSLHALTLQTFVAINPTYSHLVFVQSLS